MEGLVVVLGVLVIALSIGLVVVWRRLQAATVEPEPAQVIDEQVTDLLNLLQASGILVGEQDNVAFSTTLARNFGLVRGNRITSPELLEAVREARRTGEPISLDLELRRDQGGPRLKLAARVCPMRDKTILVLAEDQGERARVDETKRDFVANVTHELKTPIGAISLLAEAVEEAADDPEAVRRFAERMYREASRLSELVAQIIELSRLQSDEPLLSAEVIRVGDVVASAADHNRERAANRNVHLVVAGDQDLLMVGDADQLADAVGNLIQNAIVYSDPGARVAVATKRVTDDDDDVVEISVADNGIGIEASELERIFERFYRVDFSRSRDNGGTGLGLSIVKHIVAAHGGSVNVWSQVGQGSTFTLRIPTFVPDASADSAEIEAATRFERKASKLPSDR